MALWSLAVITILSIVLSSALWSLAAIIVPEHQLATGYGIMQVGFYTGV